MIFRAEKSGRKELGREPETKLSGCARLQVLRVKSENVSGLQGPYTVKEIDNDPWGHPYLYRFPGEHGDEPDLTSYGADGQPGGDGNNADIVSWKN